MAFFRYDADTSRFPKAIRAMIIWSLAGAIIGPLVLGFLGLLLAGWAGAGNMAVWGLFIGIPAGLLTAGANALAT